MDYTEFLAAFELKLGSGRLVRDELMRAHTTWRVGGAADLFFESKTVDELILAVKLAREYSVPFFVLGGGANILVGDKGVRGLVIKNVASEFEFVSPPDGWQEHSTGEYRHTAIHFHYYDDEKNPNYHAEKVFVRLTAGYSMPAFIRDGFEKGLTGLEWFARIPGTLGGWIYNNVHGHTLFIGDFTHSVRVLTESGEVVERLWSDLDLGYDYSIFHTNKEVILDAKLRLFKGNVEMAKGVYGDVLKKKIERQPSNSAGCVFHNVTAEEQKRNNFESDAIGYIVDKVMGWNGSHKVGGAWISQKHGDFIETDGTATAADVLAVMEGMKEEFRTRFGIELKEEIFRVGEF